MSVSINNFSKPLCSAFIGLQTSFPPPRVLEHSIDSGKRSIENILQSEFIFNTNIKRITSETEFDYVLARLKRDRSWKGGWWNIDHATKYEQAIIPYTGEQDISAHLNWYMYSGNIVNPNISEEITREYIRAMCYALPEIDKVYGKYTGIVYRCGYMEKMPKSFVSTTSDPMGLRYIIHTREDYRQPFYIVYTNNGHRIEDMQKKLGCRYQCEHEIILSSGTQYEEVTKITPKMEELQHKMKEAIRDDFAMPSLNITFLREINCF